MKQVWHLVAILVRVCVVQDPLGSGEVVAVSVSLEGLSPDHFDFLLATILKQVETPTVGWLF